MRCCRDIVYGPGSDDYGRDNLLEDWECPGCHKITKHTRRDVRMGIDVCECGWQSEMGKMMSDALDKLPRMKK